MQYTLKKEYKEAVEQIIQDIKKQSNQIGNTTVNFLSEKDTVLDYTVFIDLLFSKMYAEKILLTSLFLKRSDRYKAASLDAPFPKPMFENGDIPENMEFEFQVFWNKDSETFISEDEEYQKQKKQALDSYNQKIKAFIYENKKREI